MASPVPPGAILTWDEEAGDFVWSRVVPYDGEGEEGLPLVAQAAQRLLRRAVREATERAESPWMDAERTAVYLGLPSVEALYAHIARHADFPTSRMGKRLLFNREEIDRHLIRPSTPRHHARTVQAKVRAVAPTRGER